MAAGTDNDADKPALLVLSCSCCKTCTAFESLLLLLLVWLLGKFVVVAVIMVGEGLGCILIMLKHPV